MRETSPSPPDYQVSIWLTMLDNYRRDLMPLYPEDFKKLARLIPLHPERVLKTREGEARVIMIDRKKTLAALKTQYAFHSKTELATTLKETNDGSDI